VRIKNFSLFTILWSNRFVVMFCILFAFLNSISNVAIRYYGGKIIDDPSTWQYSLLKIGFIALMYFVSQCILTYSLNRLEGKTIETIYRKLFHNISNAKQVWIEQLDKGNSLFKPEPFLGRLRYYC